MSTLDPVVVTRRAMFEPAGVQVNVAEGMRLLDASYACASSVWCQPSVTLGLEGVTVTRDTCGAVTVTLACPNVPFDVAVARSVAVPVPVGVTVTVAPVVVLSGA